MKTVLQLVTYDISNPQSGGAIRAYHIANALRKDFIVYTIVFNLKNIHAKVTWNDDPNFNRAVGSCINIDFETCLSKIGGPGDRGCLMDWGICEYVLQENTLVKSLVRMIKNLDPAIVLLEQPFLWPIVDMLKKSALKSDHTTIYSSHNAEAPMKKEIYQTAFPDGVYQQHLSHVDGLERASIHSADLIIATSDFDAAHISAIDQSKQILIYPNGHTFNPSKNNQWWRDRFDASGDKNNWVYVSSAHPPNVIGLRALIDAIPKEQQKFKIWLLGSIGKALDLSQYPFIESYTEISNQDIDDAIFCSDGIILPVQSGGGTNLKTAQALLSGKSIVSTSFAFRGFEQYRDQHGIKISDSVEEMINFLERDVEESNYQRNNLELLDLEQIMSTLPKKINDIL